MPSIGLIKRKEIWVPTWLGWVLLLALITLVLAGLAVVTVPFLAPVKPLSKGVLVVEGWLPDYALEAAKKTFESEPYRLLVVTGVPIEQGLYLTKETNFAQLAGTTLQHLGLNQDRIVKISCPEVPRDRTFATARRVRTWLDARSEPEAVDIFTLGVHARRTWLLYRVALGDRYPTGVIATADRRYDPESWWKTSSGFRTVTSEVIAYFYAKLLFHPNQGKLTGDEKL